MDKYACRTSSVPLYKRKPPLEKRRVYCEVAGRGRTWLHAYIMFCQSALQSAGGGRVPKEHTSPGAAGVYEGAEPPVFM